jgi:excisionase family DNA binding protein
MHNTTQPEPKIVRADTLATILDCAKSTVYGMAKSKKIPSILLGKQGVRFDLQEVMAALKRKAR